ncbi:hypothetical protein GCM10009765_58130 [Fodinicola feengrottensis]|uniref:DNA-binding protein n=1 Tax=Fodinicola feengrottensis TaxID=435914 RepID=A0ABN2I9M5_9ACTN
MPQGTDWLTTAEAAARLHVPPEVVVSTVLSYGADPDIHIITTVGGPMISRCAVAFAVADRQLNEATRSVDPTETAAFGPSLGRPYSMKARNQGPSAQ